MVDAHTRVPVGLAVTQIQGLDNDRTSVKIKNVGFGGPLYLGTNNQVSVNTGYALESGEVIELKRPEGDQPELAIFAIGTNPGAAAALWTSWQPL